MKSGSGAVLMPVLRMREAVRDALAHEMRLDDSVVVLGEDVAEAGGIFKATDGLLEEFGASRVRDTPISEMGFMGAAVGAALGGLRPVVEFMFGEFMGVALDQIVTQAAKMRYLTGGRLSVPLTVRASVGSGLGFGCQHSQCLENWLGATPGLKVVVPSGPQEAYDLLRASIRDPDPVVFLEPRSLYAQRAPVEQSAFPPTPLGTAAVQRLGSDLTIVTLGAMVEVCREAAKESEWQPEIVDLRSLVPWDKACVEESVKRTGRIAIVQEGPEQGGWGNEIAATVTKALFADLTSPPLQIASPYVPVPYSRKLEHQYRPTADRIRREIDALMGGKVSSPWWETPC